MVKRVAGLADVPQAILRLAHITRRERGHGGARAGVTGHRKLRSIYSMEQRLRVNSVDA